MEPENLGPGLVELRADDLAADAGPLRLFSGLNFSIKNGQALILRGANGSGKTTLLRVVAGLYPRAAGVVNFGNSKDGDVYNASQNCHFLGHKNGLKTAQSVRENLAFFAHFNGGREGVSVDAAVTQAAARLALTALLDLPVSLLSAGQARRAAFARLLMSSRPIWCLDEPTAALDSVSCETVEHLCRSHLHGGGLLIASTHLPFLSGIDDVQDLTLAGYSGLDADLEPAS